MIRSLSLSDLVARVDIVESAPQGRMGTGYYIVPVPSCHDWVQELVSFLVAAGTDADAVCESFRRAFDSVNIEGLRHYFSRIPVSFTYTCVQGERRSPSTRLRVTEVMLAREGQTYEIGSEQCPKEYFEKRLETRVNRVKTGERVWGLYPPEAAKQLLSELIPTWDETDSVIDWLFAFVQTEAIRPSPRIDCQREGDDIVYRFTYPAIDSIVKAVEVPAVSEVFASSVSISDGSDLSDATAVEVVEESEPTSTAEVPPVSEVAPISELEPVSTVVKSPQVHPTEDEVLMTAAEALSQDLSDAAEAVSELDPSVEVLSAKEQICRFIKNNGETRTDEVIKQKFASVRQTKRLLSQLVNEDRLERVGHGVYRAIETESNEDGKTD